jgi:hypothetical protein
VSSAPRGRSLALAGGDRIPSTRKLQPKPFPGLHPHPPAHSRPSSRPSTDRKGAPGRAAAGGGAAGRVGEADQGLGRRGRAGGNSRSGPLNVVSAEPIHSGSVDYSVLVKPACPIHKVNFNKQTF